MVIFVYLIMDFEEKNNLNMVKVCIDENECVFYFLCSLILYGVEMMKCYIGLYVYKYEVLVDFVKCEFFLFEK